MRYIIFFASVTILLFGLTVTQAAEDERQLVNLPDPMRDHMLSSMRDHLATINEIQAELAKGDYDKAADTAEQRLGMSSLAAHNASHMAPFMPKAMQETGTEMHHAASRFARTAQEAAVSGNLATALESLSKVTQQCVACHAAYRIH